MPPNQFGSIFHYTDLNALKSILDKSELWLSHVHFMNDHSEFDFCLKIIREGLRRKVEEYAGAEFEGFKFFDAISEIPVYVSSFCIESDLLSQWRAYCPSSGGYALEFDFDNIGQQVNPLADTVFQICCYAEEVQKAELERKISEIFEAMLKIMDGRQSLMTSYQQICESLILSLQLKDKGFREEREVRLISIAKNKTPSFRAKGSILIPYYAFPFDVNAVKRIVIGPMQESELAQRGLEMYLNQLCADESHPLKTAPEIAVSAIPLRRIG